MHEDLFAQAVALATLDRRKPKQVNLRRALSSAYYAVFHYLTDESCRLIFGSQHAAKPYRDVLCRAFSHTVMKQACNNFRGGKLKESVIKGLPRDAAGNYPIALPTRDVASTFVDLQEKRQLADYARSERFERSEVLGAIEQAKVHVSAFAALPMTDDKRFFLACLWAWKELTNR